MQLSNPRLQVKYVFFLLLWMLFIYGPVLDSPLGALGDIGLLLALFLLPLSFKYKSPLFVFWFTIIILLITSLAIINTIFTDTETVNIAMRAILRPLRALVIIFATLTLVRWTMLTFNKEKVETDHLFYIGLVYWSIVIHAIIMIVQFFSPQFKDLIYNFTMAKYQLEHYQNFRMAGLSGGGGSQLSFTQGLGFAIGLYLLQFNRKIILLYIANSAIVFSIFLSGRSGFIIVLLAILFYTLRITPNSKINLSSLLKPIAVFFALIAVGYLLPLLLGTNEYIKVAFDRTFDTLINYQKTGQLSDNTLNSLGDMIHLPDELLHLLIGKASYLQTNTYYDINTDIGYFRLIWGYGIIGVVLHCIFYCVFISVFINHYAKDSKMAQLGLFLIFTVLLFNAKEIFFFTKMSFQITLLILFIFYFYYEEENG